MKDFNENNNLESGNVDTTINVVNEVSTGKAPGNKKYRKFWNHLLIEDYLKLELIAHKKGASASRGGLLALAGKQPPPPRLSGALANSVNALVSRYNQQIEKYHRASLWGPP